jgi:hypothetical protein
MENNMHDLSPLAPAACEFRPLGMHRRLTFGSRRITPLGASAIGQKTNVGPRVSQAKQLMNFLGRHPKVPIVVALCLGFLLAILAFSGVAAAQEVSYSPNERGPVALQNSVTAPPAEGQALMAHRPRLARFLGEPASVDAQQVADWVVDSGDNRRLPFVIVDKTDAKVFVFDSEGQLRGAAPALLGLARGDDSVAGIGDRKLSTIRPDERTTPAGRFVAALGNDLGTRDIVWVDYAAAVSLHRVITTSPKERRLQRLATASPLDNRISYGCINVAEKFYDTVVNPAFTGTNGIVYILPETRSIRDVFPEAWDQGSGLRPSDQPRPAP